MRTYLVRCIATHILFPVIRAKKHCPLVFSQGRSVECAGPCRRSPAPVRGAAQLRRPRKTMNGSSGSGDHIP
jgi:hypothetical protein